MNQNYLIENRKPESIGEILVRVDSKYEIWVALRLTLNAQEYPNNNIDNCYRIIENLAEFSGHIWFDEFHKKIFTDIPKGMEIGSTKPREWSDHDDLALTLFIQRSIGIRSIRKDPVSDAVQLYAKENIRNEPM